MPKLSELFETETCGRCLGSGRYSFNMIDGDRCYGCGGRGYCFTKAGSAAKDAWVAAWKKTKRMSEVEVGERIMMDDFSRGKRVVRTIAESSADERNAGQNRWDLKFVETVGIGGYGAFVDTEIDLPVTAAEKRAAYDKIAGMPGALGWPVEVSPSPIPTTFPSEGGARC